MKIISKKNKRYNHGGTIHFNGDPVKKPSDSFVGTAVATAGAGPNYLTDENFEQVKRIVDALEAGQDVIYDPGMAPAIAEERKFREKGRSITPMATDPGFYEGYMVDDSGRVLHTGSAKSQAPVAEFLTPAGDLMAIGEGANMFTQGVREGNLGKTGLGAGLALGSVGMAFLPGNANMIRTWGESVDDRVIQDIVSTIDESRITGSDIDLNSVMSPVFSNYSRAEREAASDEISNLLDVAEDPYSGFDLNSEEKQNLTDIMFSLSADDVPAELSSPSIRFQDPSVESTLPNEIKGFKKFERSDDNGRLVSYENPISGDYIDLSTSPIEGQAPAHWVQAYPESYINKMNVDMTSGKNSGELMPRDVYSMMTKIMDQVVSGDIVAPGSLSTDSYPIFLRQLDKGKKYLTEGGKKQGTKVLDRVPSHEAMKFEPLNNMGQFTNFFKIPEEFAPRVATDGMLTHYGTSRALIGPGGFNSMDEANKFLIDVKTKYIDPELAKRGLPPAEVDLQRYKNDYSFSERRASQPIMLRFPLPFVEKLFMGGKIKTIKKAKKGLKLRKK